MEGFNSMKSRNIEKKLKELKEDFVKLISQLREIQEVQKSYREIQKKKVEGKYPFINTQSSSTV
jgi:D-arabinose 1-dehydrogenase-like Zn-dependent alcohol dehydrogenase